MPQHKAFTLIELIVVLAVAVILAGVAVPSLTQFLEQQHLRDHRDRIVRHIRFTRNAAISHNAFAVMCVLDADRRACAAHGGWQNGWMVFTDPNRDNHCEDLDGDSRCDADQGALLRISPARADSRLRILGNYFVRRHVRFDPRGHSYVSNGTISVCPVRADSGISPVGIILSNPGRVRVTADPDRPACGGS